MLRGGAGRDTLDGNLGDDMLTAGAGEDVLDGGVGRDVLVGGDDNDFMDGGAGHEGPAHLQGEGGGRPGAGQRGPARLALGQPLQLVRGIVLEREHAVAARRLGRVEPPVGGADERLDEGVLASFGRTSVHLALEQLAPASLDQGALAR